MRVVRFAQSILSLRQRAFRAVGLEEARFKPISSRRIRGTEVSCCRIIAAELRIDVSRAKRDPSG